MPLTLQMRLKTRRFRDGKEKTGLLRTGKREGRRGILFQTHSKAKKRWPQKVLDRLGTI
jgi:hypothetical protein